MGNFLDSIVETTTKNINLETKEEIKYLKYYSDINKLIEEAAYYGRYELTLTFKSVNDYPKGYCNVEDGDTVIRYEDKSLIEIIENHYKAEKFVVNRKDLFDPTIELIISWKEAILEQMIF